MVSSTPTQSTAASISLWPVAWRNSSRISLMDLFLVLITASAPVLLGDGQFLVASAEPHDRCPGRQQLGILDRVSAQAVDADDRDNPVWPEGARVSQFLEASIRREPCIGERRQFFGFQETLSSAPYGSWQPCRAS